MRIRAQDHEPEKAGHPHALRTVGLICPQRIRPRKFRENQPDGRLEASAARLVFSLTQAAIQIRFAAGRTERLRKA